MRPRSISGVPDNIVIGLSPGAVRCQSSEPSAAFSAYMCEGWRTLKNRAVRPFCVSRRIAEPTGPFCPDIQRVQPSRRLSATTPCPSSPMKIVSSVTSG